MNARTLTEKRLTRARSSMAKNLRPESLMRAIESFEVGRYGESVRLFEAIEERDDIISGLSLKRRKNISRLNYEIICLEEGKSSNLQKVRLEKFFENLRVKSLTDGNECGGIKLLVRQMMNAVGMKYATHRIDYTREGENLICELTQYPLWMFENTSGKLRLLEREGQLTDGIELIDSEWMITVSDGLMVPSSIMHMYKQLAMKDWIIYCERNGMPGVKATTDAFPGSEQWDNTCLAAAEFGAEFHAVFSKGTDIEAIDLSSRGELPYPSLIERMDRVLSALWRGSDLSTLSGDRNGATMQWYESTLIEEEDVSNINETINSRLVRDALKLIFGDTEQLVKFQLMTPDYEEHKADLEVIERLVKLGMKPDLNKLAKRFSFPMDMGGKNE